MFPFHRPFSRVLLLSALLLMIPGFVPFAMAQPEEGDSPEADLGAADKVLHEAVVASDASRGVVPDPIRAEAVIVGEEVSKTNAAAWHAAGFRGAAKVGIIDAFSATVWNAAQTAGEVPAPAGVFCRDGGAACDIWTVNPGAAHGTAVAEIIHEMAPDASLFLARPVTLGDFEVVIDHFAAQGVQVIYNGLWVTYGSPGDGTGFEARLIDNAVSAGMAWINAVDDLANGGYWRGTWVDVGGDGFLDFASGIEVMEFLCRPGYGLRWNDWTAPNPTDYDVLIFEDLAAVGAGTVKAGSARRQVTGSAPWEDYNPSLGAAGCAGPTDVDYLAIFLFDPGNGTAGDILELGVIGGGEFWSDPFSAAVPFADTANPGALAVGAIEPPLGTVASPFSSRGPTNDGRFKPDVAAASGVSNMTFGTFFGTTAAAATTAGAAALVAGADSTAASATDDHTALALTPAEISTYLTTQAIVDGGVAGQDNIYGHGELVLPAPPKPPIAVDDSYATPPGVTLTVPAAKGVLANDTHPDGDELTVSKSDTSAKGGTVAVKADGSFSYKPAAAFSGSDTFSYTASNGVMTDAATVTVLVGGVHTVGLVDPAQGKWYLYDENGVQQSTFFFGNPGDFPIYGDWDGDGIETPGMYRQSDGFVYLRDSNTQGVGDTRFFFGNPGDIPLAGDFNGDGRDTVSIYRPATSEVFIINELGKDEGGLGAADFSYFFGNPGDKPFVGDFDGNGEETVGLHRESTGLVYFRNTHTQGVADEQFIFGDPGDRLVAGDWTSNGVFSPALFRPSNTTTFFRYTNTQGNADAQWTNGQSTWLPISGDNGLG